MKKLLFILFLVPILSFSQGRQYGGKNGVNFEKNKFLIAKVKN